MATSKTLAPTNVTISIPAMTDAPNASVLSNCIDKEADAINTLNSHISRIDCSISIETFAESVEDGSLQYFRMRNSEPNSTWNYSVGFVFAPTSAERIVVMFDRGGSAIAMKAKYSGSWGAWRQVALSAIT